MTETSPIGSIGRRKSSILHLPEEEQRKYLIKQGRPHILTDMRIADDSGEQRSEDGKAAGNLQVRGPLVVKEYFRVCNLHYPEAAYPETKYDALNQSVHGGT